MTNKNDIDTTDEDLDGFEPMESAFDEAPETDAGAEEHVDDADFQDISDDIDADVFGEGQPADEAPKKKGPNWFNIGVAFVAVLVAGGLIFMKLAPSLLGGSGNNAETPPAAAAGTDAGVTNTEAGANAAAQQALQPQTQAVTGPGLLNNPDQYATLNQVPAGSVVEAKTAPESDPFASLGGAAAPAPATTPEQAPTSAIVPMPNPISGSGEAAPDTSSITKDAAAATPATTPAATNAGAAVLDAAPVVGSAPAASNNATTAELKAQVSALQQKFEDLDSKVSSAVEKIGTATGSATPVDDARLSTIQTTLERLETRLDDLSSKRTTTAVSTPRAATYDDAGPVIVRKASVKKAGRSNTTSNSKWDEPYTPSGARPAALTESAKAAPSAAGTGGWELRGAQNGRAIIAKAGDMREVGVGDNVPGLGEVMGIATMNGRWVVQGSKGRVSQ